MKKYLLTRYRTLNGVSIVILRGFAGGDGGD
jgi:hypothetical protein